MRIKFQKGFSLVETILVLTIATVVAFLSVQKQARDTEYAQADLAGQQLQFLSNAFNSYIASNYGEFVTFAGTAGVKDPVTSCTYITTTVCQIKNADFSTAFVTPGFLPTNSSYVSVYGINYNFYVRIQGTAPNLYAEGLIVSASPLTIAGSNPRYDLIGELLSNTGITGGEVPSATVAPTLQFQTVSGAYSLTNTGSSDFPFPSSRGIWGNYLKFQQYSEFLRRDGTLPMTGDLNMGGPACLTASSGSLSCSTTVGNLINTNSVQSPTGGNLTLDGDQGIIINSNNGQPLYVNAAASLFTGTVTATSSITAQSGDVTASSGNVVAGNNVIATNALVVGGAQITNPSGTVAKFNGGVEVQDLFLDSRGGIALSVALPYYSSRGAFLVTDSSTITEPNCAQTPSSGATPSYPSDDTSPTGIGTPKIIVTPANILALGVTDNLTFETGVTFIANATLSGSTWTVHIETTDPTSGAAYGSGLYGIAHVYCVYGN